MAEKDYYRILGVAPDAGDDVIKKEFRKLAKKYHPDTNGGSEEAAQKFQEINEAYSVLGDEDKRKAYDMERAGQKTGPGQNEGKASGAKGKANPFGGFTASNFKMDFGDMMFDELNNEKKKQETKNGQMDFSDVSSQFANFFGFRPK